MMPPRGRVTKPTANGVGQQGGDERVFSGKVEFAEHDAGDNAVKKKSYHSMVAPMSAEVRPYERPWDRLLP
jgi:hypothetical protein